MKQFFESSPFYNSIPHVQGLMIGALNQFIFTDLISNLLYTFSKYSHDSFSMQGLSEKLGLGLSE